MMMDCPKGWKSNAKLSKNITIQSRTVNICDGICDSADLCGKTDCEHYDITREGTRRFQKANAYEHTLEGMIEVQKLKRLMKAEKENLNFK
jgi:hypothetical protein